MPKPLSIILLCFLAIAVIFILVLIINAIREKSKRSATNDKRKNVSEEELSLYVTKLQKMIACKTVFEKEEEKEFERFREVLKQQFPLFHEKAELTIFGGGCLIYKLKGKNATKNVMLMSHHDVVEATGEWVKPPFSGEVFNGALYGRGSIDTKTPLFGELQAVENLLKKGYEFEGVNLYIGSSHNEEVSGDGMVLATDYFKKNAIHFEVVLDEGGAITTGMMPGVKEKSAMIAVHEKGRHIVNFFAKNNLVGHGGLNPPSGKSTVLRMSEFIAEAENSKLSGNKFYEEVEGTFKAHAPYMPFGMRILFANFNVFKGLLKYILPKISGAVRSMFKTTMSFTMIEGGTKAHLQSKETAARAFFRCVREDDYRIELEKVRKIAKKHDVEVEEFERDYCRPSSAKDWQYKVLEKTLNQNFPDVIVSPFLLPAGSDARRFSEIADSILRFAPIDLSKEQYMTIHAPNENISIKNIGECVCFYEDFIKNFINKNK